MKPGIFCFGGCAIPSIQGSADHIVGTWQIMYKNGQCFTKKEECMNQQVLELLWLFHDYVEWNGQCETDLVEEFIAGCMFKGTVVYAGSFSLANRETSEDQSAK